MSEAAANSKEKKEIEVSKTILPENEKYESKSLNYEIKIPDWLLKDINNYEKSNKENDENQKLIVKAFKLAYKAHDGQFRASGEPYIIHPVAVANLLKEIGASSSVIAAGLLHDVVEDTGIDLSEIETNFGLEVKILVEGVTKLGGIHFNNRTEAQAENLRKMFMAMASDIRVVLVKLADRLHNMRTIEAITKVDNRKRIAQETMEIYAPLADRMGMHRIRDELEDLSFEILNNDARKLIKKDMGIISKIENKHALKNIKKIIQATDSIMIARGDLAIEIGHSEVPKVQLNLSAYFTTF